MTGILREIVGRTVAGQTDMLLLNRDPVPDLGEAITRLKPDVAIVSDERGGHPVSYEPLLLEHTNLKLLVVRGDGRHADLLELRAKHFNELTPRSLVSAIRSSRRPRSAARSTFMQS
jgi:hypothetical protein